MKKLLQRLVFVAAAVATSSAMAAATFFEGPQFRGQPLSLDGVVPDFRAYDFNDRAMSIVVEGAPVEVCEHVNFGGSCQVFAPGEYARLGIWSNTISSMRPAYYPRAYHHRHYEHGYDYRPQWGREQWGYAQRGYYERGY